MRSIFLFSCLVALRSEVWGTSDYQRSLNGRRLDIRYWAQASHTDTGQPILWAGQAVVDRGNHQCTQTNVLNVKGRTGIVTCYSFWYWQIDIVQEKAGVFVLCKTKIPIKNAHRFPVLTSWPMRWCDDFIWVTWVVFSSSSHKNESMSKSSMLLLSSSGDSEWPGRVAFGKTWFISHCLKTLGKLSEAGG